VRQSLNSDQSCKQAPAQFQLRNDNFAYRHSSKRCKKHSEVIAKPWNYLSLTRFAIIDESVALPCRFFVQIKSSNEGIVPSGLTMEFSHFEN